MPAKRLLTVENLVIEGFQEGLWRRIVDDVSFHLDRGEVLGLIGESGAGKSTIGIAAMGYTRYGCRIAGGSIDFDGIDLATAPEAVRRSIRGVRASYVAQSAAASFNPAHPILAQCAENAIQHGTMPPEAARSHARKMFKQLDMPDPEHIGDRYPHEVSGGQLQRAMVAMAMSCGPDLMVFDEPTTALDVTTQIEVLKVIKQAIEDLHSAALYITHDLAVVSQVAHRIMVLRHGRVVEVGETRELLRNPREDYTRALLSVRKVRGIGRPPAPDDGPILSVKNVSAAYGNSSVRVLEDVSLEINRGRTVSLVGESGSGKSTLARVITGLLPPREGHVDFAGQRLAADYRQRNLDTLRRIQIIYQMPDVAVNPRQKIKDIIGRPVGLYFGKGEAERLQRTKELLALVDLDERYLERYPSEISGGEKQRVCIARALAASPEVIVCDEITSALDQLVADGILKLLQRLQKELHLTLLFITHDFATVSAISDEVVVMRNGRVVETGTRDQIFQHPTEDYTKRLLASVPEMDPDWLARLMEKRHGVQRS